MIVTGIDASIGMIGETNIGNWTHVNISATHALICALEYGGVKPFRLRGIMCDDMGTMQPNADADSTMRARASLRQMSAVSSLSQQPFDFLTLLWMHHCRCRFEKILLFVLLKFCRLYTVRY
jgi:hypothetical protein